MTPTRDRGDWRNNPTIKKPVWARDDVDWHKTDTLPDGDGTSIGKLGGLWYILDADGQAISEGYHEIHVDSGRLVGKRGAIREPVEYRREDAE